MKSLPAFYFPTTLICIDDNQLVLDGHKSLFRDTFKCICYTNAKNAQIFFDSYEPPLDKISFLDSLTEFEHENFALQSAVQFDVAKIIDLTKNNSRYNEVAVILSDYYMPGMNGLELCQTLGAYKFKKMLLTENDDYHIAKQALNSGTIDYFANKIDPTSEIEATVKNLAINYFCDITAKFIYHLGNEGISALTDPNFIKHFLEILQLKNIAEYYLIDKNGSYLLIAANKQEYILIVHNDRSLDEFIDLISEYNILDVTLKGLNHRKIIPFWGIQKGIMDINLSAINHYLYPAYTIKGKQAYFLHLLEF